MGSRYFGESHLGNERSGGSSRKGKKNNSDKPKQPQRGLGVAQLEKIRLHSQMGCSYLPSVHNPYPTTNFTQGQEDLRLQAANNNTSSSSFSYSPSSPSSYGFPGQQSIMMGFSELERANVGLGDYQPTTAASMFSSTTRWSPGNAALEAQQFAQPSMSRHLLNQQVEDSKEKNRKKDRSDSMGSNSQNSDSSGNQELDLELRLSL